MKNVIKKQKALYVSDIHNDKLFLNEMFETIMKKKIENVIIGGDIVCSLSIAEKVHSELDGRGFERDKYIERFKMYHNKELERLLIDIGLFKLDCRSRGFDPTFYLLPGNDDWFDLELLDDAEGEGIIKNLHLKFHGIFKRLIVGCAFIPHTPFSTNYEINDEELYNYLEHIGKVGDEETIYVIHAPPKNTNLDLSVGRRKHLGSASVRKFISEFQPCLTLHGHIHESYGLTKVWKEKIGKTISINLGRDDGIFRGVIFTEDLKFTLIEKKLKEICDKDFENTIL
ncbi:MAG: metallophosphoesterase [Candidatus Micrarchaeia archaeon]